MTSRSIKKVIFPVAGLGTRFLPVTKSIPKEMLPIIDKPLIQYAIEEAVEAGCEEFILVTGRGKSAIEDHFDHHYEIEHALKAQAKTEALQLLEHTIYPPGSISYVRQQEPLGLGHAIWCARHLIKNEPVAIILPDDLIKAPIGCLKQMVDQYQSGNMIAVMEVAEEEVSRYGIVEPGLDHGPLVEVRGLVEKPSISEAPSQLAIVGRYIIEPEVFAELSHKERGAQGEIQLTDSLAKRIGQSSFVGYRFHGTRYDCGSKFGHLQANIAYALDHSELSEKLKIWLSSL